MVTPLRKMEAPRAHLLPHVTCRLDCLCCVVTLERESGTQLTVSLNSTDLRPNPRQAAAVYFLINLLSMAWRVRWLLILGVRVARGLPGPRARRRALATFAARPATVPPQVGA